MKESIENKIRRIGGHYMTGDQETKALINKVFLGEVVLKTMKGGEVE